MDLSNNYWGGQVNHATPKDNTEESATKDTVQPKIVSEEDRVRARVAVSMGEAELYLIQMPPVDFSMLEIGLSGEIYELLHEGKVYGYTNNPRIFRGKK